MRHPAVAIPTERQAPLVAHDRRRTRNPGKYRPQGKMIKEFS
ncbi:hypothetical protein L489_3812 [Bordetella bronchiseptica 00-P-2730]|nr:hypothetical protein L489_3812 [Bordetella bronchiseptica 00-P-2730]